jgi:DNA-3-methyladenine glycosylase II
MKSLSFELRAVPPFRLDLTAWALRRRPHNLVDRWVGTSWRRVLVIDDRPLETTLMQLGTSERPRLQVTLSGNRISEHAKRDASKLLRQIFGLGTDLSAFYLLAARDKRLDPLAQRFRGLKPPRFPSVFEGLVNAIACQQLSLTAGLWVLNRLAEQCGPTVRCDGNVQYGFPRPKDILRLSPDSLRALGFSYAKARSLLELAQMAETGKLEQEELNKLDDDQVLGLLMNLRGIGRWTAEYVLLRGLGKIDVFPGDDVGARNRLAQWLGRDGPMNYEAVQRAVQRWDPYSGFVYFHLLLEGLTQSKALLEDGSWNAHHAASPTPTDRAFVP